MKYQQCHKCGNLCSIESLTSVLIDDPEYLACQDCIEENSDIE